MLLSRLCGESAWSWRLARASCARRPLHGYWGPGDNILRADWESMENILRRCWESTENGLRIDSGHRSSWNSHSQSIGKFSIAEWKVLNRDWKVLNRRLEISHSPIENFDNSQSIEWNQGYCPVLDVDLLTQNISLTINPYQYVYETNSLIKWKPLLWGGIFISNCLTMYWN